MSCKHNVFNKNQLGICIHVIELILALPVSGTDTITQQRQEMNYWRLRKEVNYSNANICIKNGQKSTTNSVSWRQNSLISDMHINIWLSTLTEGRYKISLYCLEIFFTVFALASFENLILKIVPYLQRKVSIITSMANSYWSILFTVGTKATTLHILGMTFTTSWQFVSLCESL